MNPTTTPAREPCMVEITTQVEHEGFPHALNSLKSAKPFLRKSGNSSTGNFRDLAHSSPKNASLRFRAIPQGGGLMQAFPAQSQAQQRPDTAVVVNVPAQKEKAC